MFPPTYTIPPPTKKCVFRFIPFINKREVRSSASAQILVLIIGGEAITEGHSEKKIRWTWVIYSPFVFAKNIIIRYSLPVIWPNCADVRMGQGSRVKTVSFSFDLKELSNKKKALIRINSNEVDWEEGERRRRWRIFMKHKWIEWEIKKLSWQYKNLTIVCQTSLVVFDLLLCGRPYFPLPLALPNLKSISKYIEWIHSRLCWKNGRIPVV